MKFSFDAESYRKNLASEIKEKRSEGNREDAKELLDKERETLRYHVAEDIKNVLRKIEQKEDVIKVDDNFSQEKTTEKGKEISCEVIKMTGSDGTERELEVRTFDVTERIPEEMRLMFDIERLAALDRKFDILDIGPKKFATKTDVRSFNFEDYITASYPDAKEITEERRQRIYDAICEAYYDGYTERFPDKSSAFDAPEIKKLNEFIDGLTDIQEHMFAYKLKLQELNEIARDLTDGDYLRGNMLCHVVAALGVKGDLTHLPSEQPDDYRKLIRRRLHQKSDSDIPEEDIFNVHTAESKTLWFSTKDVWSTSPNNIILVCNPKNDRFKKELGDNVTDDAIDEALSSNPNNMRIEFKRKEPWFYIADWVVDVYHGRLYKITEMTES